MGKKKRIAGHSFSKIKDCQGGIFDLSVTVGGITAIETINLTDIGYHIGDMVIAEIHVSRSNI